MPGLSSQCDTQQVLQGNWTTAMYEDIIMSSYALSKQRCRRRQRCGASGVQGMPKHTGKVRTHCRAAEGGGVDDNNIYINKHQTRRCGGLQIARSLSRLASTKQPARMGAHLALRFPRAATPTIARMRPSLRSGSTACRLAQGAPPITPLVMNGYKL